MRFLSKTYTVSYYGLTKFSKVRQPGQSLIPLEICASSSEMSNYSPLNFKAIKSAQKRVCLKVKTEYILAIIFPAIICRNFVFAIIYRFVFRRIRIIVTSVKLIREFVSKFAFFLSSLCNPGSRARAFSLQIPRVKTSYVRLEG